MIQNAPPLRNAAAGGLPQEENNKLTTTDRLETLKQFVEKDPKNSFALYGVAMEYAQRGEHDQAMEYFRKLWEVNPDYAYAYYHGGQVLAKMGNAEEARRAWEKGIEASRRTGDDHARSELEAALSQL